MNKYDKELEEAWSAAESARLAELEYQINRVLEVLDE